MANTLEILYANGQVQAVQMYVWDGVKPIPWDGSVTFSGSITIGSVNQGNAGTQPWQMSLYDGSVKANVLNLAGNKPLAVAIVDGAGTQLTSFPVTNSGITSIDGKTPALGQAVAAGSVPVVLTAAQITTLTPPAAITNYANETGGNLAALLAVLGATSGAAVITDINATIQQYLRGLIKLAITAGGFLVTAALAAGSNLIGKVNLAPATSGGFTTYHLVSAGSTNAAVVKASAGQLFGWYIYNSNVAARKVTFHNAATTPTAGASVFFSLVIPALSGANVFNETGIPFSTGIAITTVTGLADNDSTAVALNDLVINLFYA